jgi:hypothetical protein
MTPALEHNMAQKVYDAYRSWGDTALAAMPSMKEYMAAVRRRVADDKLGDQPGAVERLMADSYTDDDKALVKRVGYMAFVGEFSCDCRAGPSNHRRGCNVIKVVATSGGRCG